jgi:hypothetical protein
VTSGTQSPQAWIAGGTGVVSAGVEDALKAKGLTVKRAGGADRYDTAAKLTDLGIATGSSWALTGMASGVKLADALCLGSYIGRSDGVMLLTSGTALAPPISNRITDARSKIGKVAVAGGTAVVTHEVCATISRLLP